jgi:hypothetical protein
MRRQSPFLGIPRAIEQLRYFPADLRRLFLAEGYVYSESPAEAAVLIDVLKLGRLFQEPELWLARGGETLRVLRDRHGVYRHADGVQQGEEAALLFGDRVATSAAGLGPRLHRDLTALVEAQHPDQVRLDRLTEQGAVGALRYGERWVPAALEDDGVRYNLGCLAIPPEQRQEVEGLRAVNEQRAGSLARLRESIQAMVGERLRFDSRTGRCVRRGSGPTTTTRRPTVSTGWATRSSTARGARTRRRCAWTSCWTPTSVPAGAGSRGPISPGSACRGPSILTRWI